MAVTQLNSIMVIMHSPHISNQFRKNNYKIKIYLFVFVNVCMYVLYMYVIVCIYS